MKPFIFAFLCFVVSTGCEKRKNNDSDVEWAHMKHANHFSYLISVAPGSTINVCAKDPADADAFLLALTHWFQAIGRDTRITFRKSCAKDATRTLTYVSDTEVNAPGNRQNYPNCDKPIANGNKPGGYQDADSIVRCMHTPKMYEYQYFAHETGHLMGMCDQYGSVDHIAKYCDATHQSTQAPNSIMGSLVGLQALTQDDITGIKKLAERTDIPMNATWKALIAGGAGGNATPTPPPTSKPQVGGQCSCTHSPTENTCTITRANGSFVISAHQTDAATCQYFCKEGFLKIELDKCNAGSSTVQPTPTPTPRVTASPTPTTPLPNSCSCAFYQINGSCIIQKQGANYGSAVFAGSAQECAYVCAAGALKPTLDQCNAGR